MNNQRDNSARTVRRVILVVAVMALLALFVQVGLAQENVEPLAPTAGTLTVGVSTTPAGGQDFWVTAVSSQIAWGRPGTWNNLYLKPRDIEVDDDGFLYVSNNKNGRIVKVTQNNQLIMFIGRAGTADGQLKEPNQIAIDGTLLFVTDTVNNRISVFNTNGAFVRKWGQAGDGNGQFNHPQGVAIGSDGTVYIADTFNHRIQVFDQNGNYLRQWGQIGRNAGQFRYPSHLEFDDAGNLYVADTNNSRIQIFDTQGNFIDQIGFQGTGPGFFHIPVGIDIADGLLYISDTFNNRVQKLTLDGQYIAQWRYGENGAELDRPNGLLVIGDRVYVSDMHSSLVQVFSQTTLTVDDGQQQSASLPAGTYDITQAPVTGWTLDSATCNAGGATAIPDGVRAQLTNNATVVCSFASSQ